MKPQPVERNNEVFIISAEYQVLNLLIKNPELLETHPEINEESFPHKQARDIFTGIVELQRRKEPITSLSLLRETNAINDSIELDVINRIMDFAVSETSLLPAFKILNRESVKYKLSKKLGSLNKIIESIDEIDTEKIQEILWASQQIVLNSGDRVDSKKLEECIDDYTEDLLKRKAGHYYSFGDVFLDANITRKASGGQIVLISAATGMGKSAYGLNLINGMINLGVPVMYFSLEMDIISTMDRLLAMRTQVPIQEWYVKENIDSLLKKVEKERNSLLNKPCRFIDDPSMSLPRIQSLIREFKTFYKTVAYI